MMPVAWGIGGVGTAGFIEFPVAYQTGANRANDVSRIPVAPAGNADWKPEDGGPLYNTGLLYWDSYYTFSIIINIVIDHKYAR